MPSRPSLLADHVAVGGRELDNYPDNDCTDVPAVRVLGESDIMVMTGDDKQDVGEDAPEDDESDEKLDEDEDDEEEDEEAPPSDPKVCIHDVY